MKARHPLIVLNIIARKDYMKNGYLRCNKKAGLDCVYSYLLMRFKFLRLFDPFVSIDSFELTTMHGFA